MSCFPCFSSQRSKGPDSRELPVAHATGPDNALSAPAVNGKKNPSAEDRNKDEDNMVETKNSAAYAFNFRELAAATKNFRQECLLGEGGFGRVYRGTLRPSGQVVAVKQLDRNRMQGNKEFIVEVLVLSLLHHANLVSLVGYCADGDQRLLVYEYMPSGSVEDHLLGTSHDKKPLAWTARMKIASGVAQGLEYLHEKANPPVIYRDLKSSSILLDEEFNPKLSDYGLARLGLGGNKTHVLPRVMGSYGYCAPEYERMGELTLKSDVYSFGVVLLELITGRKAIDTTRPSEQQNLVSWAKTFFKDPKKFPELADPNLESKFPVKSLNQAVGVAAMCLQDEPSVRPFMSDIVAALSFLTVAAPDEYAPPIPNQSSQVEISSASKNDHNHEEERNSNEPEDKHDSDSDKLSTDDEDDDDDDDDPFGLTSSDSDDGGSVEHRQEQDNSEKNEAQVKKSVKWASRCRSKGDSEDGIVHSIARHNSKTNSHVETAGQNLNPHSSLALDSDSDSKITKCMSENSRKMESEDGSVGSSSSSNTSDDEPEDGRSSKNSRSNGDMGPKYEIYGSNLRQDSNVGSRDGSIVFGLRSTSNMNSQDESLGSSSRRNSNADAFGVRSNSNAESWDRSLYSDSSGDSDSKALWQCGSRT